MALTLSTTPAMGVGTITYNWSYVQTFGTTLAGTSLTNGASSVTFTFPNTIVWAGSTATTGNYSFTFQCTGTDTGVVGCIALKTITLFFNDVPPTCQVTLSNIAVSPVP